MRILPRIIFCYSFNSKFRAEVPQKLFLDFFPQVFLRVLSEILSGNPPGIVHRSMHD